MLRTMHVKGAVVVSTIALAAAACGGSSSPSGEPAGGSSTSPASSSSVTETAAAQLRAGLDGLLRQHVDLTAYVVQNVVAQGSLDDPQVQGAIGALGDNTNALGDAIGSIYGDDAKKQFRSELHTTQLKSLNKISGDLEGE
jgi:hypothetical protein